MKETIEITIQLLTFLIVLATLYLTWRKYTRDHQYNAVATQESIDSFKNAIQCCEIASVDIVNRSRFPTNMKVDVFAEGMYVHYEQDESHFLNGSNV